MTDEDPVTRRAVLHRLGVGAGAVTTAATTDWGGLTDLGPDDWDPGAPAWADVQTPDTITYTYDGESYTIHLQPAEVESCEEYLTWADTQPQNSSRLPTPGLTTYNQGVIVSPDAIETDTTVGNTQALGVRVSDVTDCTYGARPRIEVLDWRPDYELTEACRLSYCEMFRRAIEHEIHHVRDIPTFKQAFEGWVAGNQQQFLATTRSADGSFTTAVERHLANRAVEFHNGRTYDGSYMPGSGPWTHERIGDSIGWDCESCADCREVSGDNWTYRDIQTWQLDVDARVRVDMGSPDSLQARLTNRYRGTFELEQVPPDTIRRLIGGTRALQETRRRVQQARHRIENAPVLFFSAVPEAVAALRGSSTDPISDGQGPLLWRGTGRVQGTFELAHVETTEPCPGEERESGKRVRAGGSVSPSEMQSEAFVAILPTDNVVKCRWPDVWLPGTHSEITWTCEEGDPKEETDTSREGRRFDPFSVFDSEGRISEPERRDGFRVYGGGWGVIRKHAQQVRDGTKAPGGHSQAELDELTNDPTRYLGQHVATDDSTEKLVSGVPSGVFQQALVRSPHPFWTVDTCQRAGFSETVQRDLYAEGPGAINHRYNLHMDAYRDVGPQAQASFSRAGSEFVHVGLRPKEKNHGDRHREIECNGIPR